MIILFVLLAVAIGLLIARKISADNKLQKVLIAVLFPIIIGVFINALIASATNAPYLGFWYKYGRAFPLVAIPSLAMIITLLFKLEVMHKRDKEGPDLEETFFVPLHYGKSENRVDFELQLSKKEIYKMAELRKQDPEKWEDNDLELVKAARKALENNGSTQDTVSHKPSEDTGVERFVQKLHYGKGESRADFEIELTKREIEKMDELRQQDPERWVDNDLELVQAAKKELLERDTVQEEVAKEALKAAEVSSEADNSKEVENQQETQFVAKPVPVTTTEVTPTQDDKEEPKDEQSTAETQTQAKLMPEKKGKKSDGNTLSKWLKTLLFILLLAGILFGISVLASFVYTKYVYPSKAKADDERLIQEAKANPSKAYEIAQELFRRDENGHLSEYHDFISGEQGICDLDHTKAGIEVANIYCQYCIDSAKKDVLQSGHIARDLFCKLDDNCNELFVKTGVELLKYGADQGVSDAQYALGCYYGGADFKTHSWNNYYTLDGNSIDHVKEAYWYQQAANQGDSDAMGNLGNAYMSGRGVAIDKTKGLRLIREAAEHGSAFYQCRLGDYYRDGIVVQTGTHKVVTGYYWDWDDDEYGNFGKHRHANTKTVTDYKTILAPDIKQAQYWWKKAADNGDETAKERLQQIFE